MSPTVAPKQRKADAHLRRRGLWGSANAGHAQPSNSVSAGLTVFTVSQSGRSSERLVHLPEKAQPGRAADIRGQFALFSTLFFTKKYIYIFYVMKFINVFLFLQLKFFYPSVDIFGLSAVKNSGGGGAEHPLSAVSAGPE